MAEETTAQAPDTGSEAADDQAAQTALANAEQNGKGQDGKGQEGAEQEGTDTPDTDWKAEAEKWKAQSRKHEKASKENSDAARKLQEIEDAKKTAEQKLQDQLAERDMELKSLKLDQVRRQAADAAGLPADLLDTITAVDPDEALEQAKRIASYITTQRSTGQAGPADLHQGARPQAPQRQTPDDWIRAASGRR